MSTKVSLVRHCKVSGAWKRFPISKGKSGRYRPEYVVVAGEDVHCPEGHYEVRWYENRRTQYKNAGRDLQDAMLVRDQQERWLAASAAATRAGSKLVEEEQRVRLSVSLDQFVRSALSRGATEVANISERVGKSFLRESRCNFADEVAGEHITRFLQGMREAGLSDRTCNNQWQRLKAMLKFAGVDVVKLMPNAPRFEQRLPQVYTDDELKAFFASIRSGYDRLIFEVLLQTGLREREAMHLAWSDLRLGTHPTLTVRSKPEAGFRIKDREERALPIPAPLAGLLAERKQNRSKEKWVLGTSSDNPNTHLLRLLKRLVRKAGLNCQSCPSCRARGECERWFLHKFRATYATTLLRHGMDLRSVQQLMGHSDIESTMRYLRPQEMPERQRMVNAAFAARP